MRLNDTIRKVEFFKSGDTVEDIANSARSAPEYAGPVSAAWSYRPCAGWPSAHRHIGGQSEGVEPCISHPRQHIAPNLGLSPAETGGAMELLLSSYDYANHLYICGPGPMLEATRLIADKQGWPDDAVHFEYFKNTNVIDVDSTFEVALARSALTLQVPAGKTILEVLHENGIEAPSSCEQGACGTCLATVIEGEPDHQDVYLSDSERSANNQIITCVSRAKSKRLVLDI